MRQDLVVVDRIVAAKAHISKAQEMAFKVMEQSFPLNFNLNELMLDPRY